MNFLVAFLPLLIILSFPLLYFGAASNDLTFSAVGMIVFFIGMSGPLIKRLQ